MKKNYIFALLAAAVVVVVIVSKPKRHKPEPVTEQTFTNASSVIFTNASSVTEKKLPSLSEDFVLGSATAVSNAVLANAPAPGWSVTCSPDGFYAAVSPGGNIMDRSDYMISTNKFRAIVTTWRYKEIWDSPSEEYKPIEFGKAKNWQPCE